MTTAGPPPVPDEPGPTPPTDHPLLTRFKTVLDSVLKVVCVTLFALLVCLVSWQVFTRLVLSDPSVWSEEAARYVFVWVSLIGVSIATGEKADVAIDYFVGKTPVPVQRVLEIVAYLSTLTFAVVVMVWGGWANSMQTWDQANPVLPISAGVLYLAVPVAGVLFTFYLLYHLVRTLSRGYTGVENTAPEEGVEL
jgi:TRAP-type C4-dicarboxylate transport system permease small subunit